MMKEKAETESMSFLEHLDQLRANLLWVGGGLLLLFVPAVFFANKLQYFLIHFSCPTELKLHFFSPIEPIMVQLKIALFATIIVGAPLIFWRLWRFVEPALYFCERRWILRLTLICSLMFLLGTALALFLAVPMLMRFALDYQTGQLTSMIGLENYVGLVGWMMLGFGLMFQLPVAIYLLAAGDIVSVATFRKQRPLVVVGIVVIAALLMPEVVSQLTLSIPAWLMFEISLVLASITLRRKEKESEGKDVDGVVDNDEKADAEPEYVAREFLQPAEPIIGSSRYQRSYDQKKTARRVRFLGGGRSRPHK